jgi:hypothetical protein
MPRRKVARHRQTQPVSRIKLSTEVLENRKPPKPLNARDVSKEALGFLRIVDTGHREREIAKRALEMWANPRVPEDAAKFWSLAEPKGQQLEFYKRLTWMTHSDLLAFVVANEVSIDDRFLPVPQRGLALADQMLANALGDNLGQLPGLEMPVPAGIVFVTNGDAQWRKDRIFTPFDNRLVDYEPTTLLAYGAHLSGTARLVDDRF